MKAITLHQPWAHLIAIGAKKFETRSWKTNYRGLLAIHSARTFKPLDDLIVHGSDYSDLKFHGPFGNYLPTDAGELYGLPFGGVVAIVKIVDCARTEDAKAAIEYFNYGDAGTEWRTEHEIAFGNYAPGRFAWMLKLVARIDTDLIRGYQGLWNLPAAEEKKIRERCHDVGVEL